MNFSRTLNTELTELGLTPFFTQQLTTEEIEHSPLVRVTEVQRSHIVASDGISEWSITPGGAWYQLPTADRPTVGDWLLLDESHEKICRLLKNGTGIDSSAKRSKRTSNSNDSARKPVFL